MDLYDNQSECRELILGRDPGERGYKDTDTDLSSRLHIGLEAAGTTEQNGLRSIGKEFNQAIIQDWVQNSWVSGSHLYLEDDQQHAYFLHAC